MITENAPPVMLLWLDEVLSDAERKRVKEIKATAPKDKSEALALEQELKAFEKKLTELRAGAPVPLVFDGVILGALPDGYQRISTKTIEMIGDEVTSAKTLNSATINFRVTGDDFVNLALGLFERLFLLDDSLPRIDFYSPQLIFEAATLLNYSRYSRADTNEQIISIEVQKGDVESVKTKEIAATKDQKPIIKVNSDLVSKDATR